MARVAFVLYLSCHVQQLLAHRDTNMHSFFLGGPAWQRPGSIPGPAIQRGSCLRGNCFSLPYARASQRVADFLQDPGLQPGNVVLAVSADHVACLSARHCSRMPSLARNPVTKIHCERMKGSCHFRASSVLSGLMAGSEATLEEEF